MPSTLFQYLRRYGEAEDEMQRAIAISPDLPDAFEHGAWIYQSWDGATERARQLLETAPSLDSPDIEFA